MKKVAVIDDNQDQSGTVEKSLRLAFAELDSKLGIVTTPPFKLLNEYFTFIEANDICVLILDEKLNDQAIDERGPVDYVGSELVSAIRQQLKEIPIFALTVIPKDSDLTEKSSLYEDIISRKEFYDNPEKFAPKIIRAAKTYLQDNEEKLSEFNELTRLIAGGNNDPEKITRLQALQVDMELPFSGFNDRKAWLDEYESQILELEELNKQIKSKMGQ